MKFNRSKWSTVCELLGCRTSRCKVILIVIMLVFVSVVLELMLSLQMEVSNGVRAYVRAEGLWAKAQKDAVNYLNRYAAYGDETDYLSYFYVIQVTLGDKKARQALSQKPPNLREAEDGFLLGQNAPEDAGNMVRFFLQFRNVSYMRQAISIWTEGDKMIEQLHELAVELHTARVDNDKERIRALGNTLHQLNQQLTQLENDFSLTLGEGSRWINHMMRVLSLLLLGIMLTIVTFISSRIIRSVDNTERQLMVSQNRFSSLMQSEMLGIVIWHSDGRILEANNAFLTMLGLDRDDFNLGHVNWRKLTPPGFEEQDKQAWLDLVENGVCHAYEKELYHATGKTIPVYMGATLLAGEDQQGVCFIINLSERKRYETQLRLAATVFDATNEGILVTDSRQRIITVNEAFCRMTGFNDGDLLGNKPKILQSGLMPPEFYNTMWEQMSKAGYWQGDALDRKQDGTVFPVHLSISSVYGVDKEATHYVAIFTDISERKAAEKRLQQLAHYDELTGLANRSLLTDRLDQAIQRGRRHQTKLAVLFFDLDNFKPVNDEYGHAFGDKLLQETATRLNAIIRSNDTIARMGGDEFVVVLEDLHSKQDASETANKIIDAINVPCQIEGHTVNVGSSVGISIYPDDSHDGHGLLKCADKAMYTAKANGRNRYYYYAQRA